MTRSGHGAAPHADWAELTVTGRCNQRCFFCYEEEREHGAEPSLDEVKELLDSAAERAKLVVLCGKEALLRRDICQIIEHAAAIDLELSVFTNGRVLARDGFVEQLAAAGLRSLQLSYHFPDADTYARCTRTTARGFDRFLVGLARLREHNAARPEQRIAVFTETDLFVLNAGRLAEMRQQLVAALGEGNLGGMRLGNLVPGTVHDIGLGHLLAPLAARRDELLAFIKSHPPEIGLELVKLPLCLAPGQEHLEKGVQYLHEGTLLTHNHERLSAISLDDDSVSAGRDVAAALARFPYRWVCRACSLVAMCRFERVAWGPPGFEPTPQQRPIPFETTTPRSVFERMGGSVPDAVERVEQLARPLGELCFPEEELIATLRDSSTAELETVDVAVDGAPLLSVTFRAGIETATFRLGPVQVPASSTAAIVGYLDVDCSSTESEAARWACMEHLAGLALPELERFTGETWFDVQGARLAMSAWELLGQGLWPGRGQLGAWQTESVEVAEGPELVLTLRLPDKSPMAAQLRFRDRASTHNEVTRSPDVVLRLVSEEAVADDTPAAFGELCCELGRRASSEPPPAPASAHLEALRGPGRCLRLRSDGWGLESLTDLQPAADLLFVPEFEDQSTETRFWVSQYQPGQACYQRVGELALTYGPGELVGASHSFAHVLLAAMKLLQDRPPSESNAAYWQALVDRLLSRSGGTGIRGWELRVRERR